MTPERSYPGAFRFPKLITIATVESRTQRGDKIETERRSYIPWGRRLRGRRTQPLGHREQPSLDPRHDVQ